MGLRDAIELGRSQILEIIARVDGPEAAVKKALEFTARDNAVQNARTLIQSTVPFVRSAPPPAPDTGVPFSSARNCMIMQAPKEWLQAAAQAARTAASNPTIQRTAVGTGTAATATGGLMGTISAVYAAPSLGAIGAMGSEAIAVSASSVLVAGAVGVGIGIGIDHLVGAVRDDGRTLSDLISGANAGAPIADPTGHGAEGWRFVAEQEASKGN